MRGLIVPEQFDSLGSTGDIERTRASSGISPAKRRQRDQDENCQIVSADRREAGSPLAVR